MFNHFFDDDRGLAHESTVALFKEIAAGKYEAYTATYVTEELEKAPDEKRDKMIGLISEYSITVLAPTDEAARIAGQYVNEGIIPQKFLTDGLHIAIATVLMMQDHTWRG